LPPAPNQPCEIEYFPTPQPHSKPPTWAFFTVDKLLWAFEAEGLTD
jgi:hypothetical protein